jgi:phage shock protein C
MTRRLMRSTHERLLSGVSGGLGDFFDIDPTLIRIGWVLAAILTHGAVFLLYLVCWLLMPTQERAYPYQ